MVHRLLELPDLRIEAIRIDGHREYIGQRLNFYRLTSGGESVWVDSGYDNAETHQRLAEALETGPPVRRALFTHVHADHIGGAIHLRRSRSLAWSMHPGEVEVRGDLTRADIDEPLDGTADVALGQTRLEVHPTPGHTPGHLCFFHRPTGSLFTGDLVVGEGTVWVGPPHGDLPDYLRSLERMKQLPVRTIYSGHGPVVERPLERIQEYLDHRALRERQISALLAEGVGEPSAMVERIYAEVDRKLWPVALLTVLGHLSKLEREGRARAGGDGRWRLA